MQKDIFSRAFCYISCTEIWTISTIKDVKQGAHVNVIYIPGRVYYIYIWRGLLFILDSRQSRASVQYVAIVPTPLYFIICFHLGIVRAKKNLYYYPMEDFYNSYTVSFYLGDEPLECHLRSTVKITQETIKEIASSIADIAVKERMKHIKDEQLEQCVRKITIVGDFGRLVVKD